MKKSLILIALAIISTAASAEGPAPAPHAGGKNGNRVLVLLTDDQKQCIDQQNCIKPDFKPGAKPDETRIKTYRDCMMKAFDTCGVKVPEHKAGDKPARPAAPAPVAQ
ncbi:MAG: hypothetical protein FWC61_03150 [Proteobacteria bacterium]|nr:hypothetical protein [Pseudomonadota bacterium]